MTRWETIRLVTGRETRERMRSKAFKLSTVFSLVIILGLAVIPGLVQSDGGPTKYMVGTVGSQSVITDRLGTLAAASGHDVRVVVREVADLPEAQRLVRDGKLDVALVGREVLVGKDGGGELTGLVQDAHRETASEAALASAGVPRAAASAALRPAPLAVREVDPQSESQQQRQSLVFVGTLLLYGQLLGYGYWVAGGILEEKASRVVEVVLAKARPSQVLTGKILGIGILGLAQLVGFMVLGLVTARAVGTVELPASTIRVAVEVVAWFVLGFAFYACMFAVGGALASRTEDLQNTTGPITVVAVIALLAATFAGGDPGGTAARVSTFIPPAAPLVLPIRSAAGELALWEAAVGVGLVLVATAGAVWLAGRVYAGGALSVRTPMKLREALTRPR